MNHPDWNYMLKHPKLIHYNVFYHMYLKDNPYRCVDYLNLAELIKWEVVS